MRKYYIIELTMVALVIWCVSLNIKLSNTISQMDTLQAEVIVLGFSLAEVNIEVTRMQEEKEDFNNLDFSEAFKVMYDAYGLHHLFEWRGRVYTTDLKQPRNITITEKEGDQNGNR